MRGVGDEIRRRLQILDSWLRAIHSEGVHWGCVSLTLVALTLLPIANIEHLLVVHRTVAMIVQELQVGFVGHDARPPPVIEILVPRHW